MSLLRYIDAEGREQDVSDVNHLYELIQTKRVGYDSLVWDEEEQRWVAARDHDFFRRIREIAAASPAPQLSPSVALQRKPARVPATPPQLYKSPLMQQQNFVADETASRPKTPKLNWFTAIQTKEEALKIIKDTSLAFFFVAVLQAAIGIWLATQYPNSGFDVGVTLIDVAIYTVCAAWLRWGRSRTAAIFLLLAATVALGTTIAAHLKIIEGGKNVAVALTAFWIAVKATFKLRGRFNDRGRAAIRLRLRDLCPRAGSGER
jgi:hypothetical protein